MKYHCDCCGFKWMRCDSGEAKYCQRCGSDWIERENSDLLNNVNRVLNRFGFPAPPVIPNIIVSKVPDKFSSQVLVIPESTIPLKMLVEKMKIGVKSFVNRIDLDRISEKVVVPRDVYWVNMCDGRVYRNRSLDETFKGFNVHERAANLREMLFLLLEYPKTIEDYYIVAPGSRDKEGLLPCAGIWNGDLTLTRFIMSIKHEDVGFATAEIY